MFFFLFANLGILAKNYNFLCINLIFVLKSYTGKYTGTWLTCVTDVSLAFEGEAGSSEGEKLPRSLLFNTREFQTNVLE